MRIDIRGSQELQDMVRALANMDADTRRAIRAFTKSEITRPWLSEIDREATTKLEKIVISSTATVAVSDQNIRITSAAKGRQRSGGLSPKHEYPGVEFGAYHKKKTYTRNGKPVTRNTTAQFRGRRTQGYVFYPAAREMIPRLASLWVQTVVKTVGLIFDGKG